MYSGHDVNVIFNLIKILSLTVKLPIMIIDVYTERVTQTDNIIQYTY